MIMSLHVYEDNSLSLLESTADPIQANTGDILLESSNSSVSDILFFLKCKTQHQMARFKNIQQMHLIIKF